MKKIICLFAAIFVFLINIIPFAASADVSTDIIDAYFASSNAVVRNDADNYYIGCIVNDTAWDGSPKPTDICIVIPKDSSISVSGDILNITDNSNTGLSCKYISHGDSGQWSATSFAYITINQASNIIYAEKRSGGSYFNNLTYSNYSDTISPQEDVYDISVSFTPVLSGNVDRKDSNGQTLESFKMTVTNRSRFDVQICMAIVKHGSLISFYNPSEGGQLALQRVISGGNPVFVWWSETPNYCFDSLVREDQNFAHEHHPDVSTFYNVEKQYGPCPWRIVGKENGVLNHTFDWSQINLEDHGNYDVFVYALRNDYGIPSRQAFSDSYDYYVDYSKIHMVYGSNFTLTNGYTFDPNNKKNGTYAYTGNDVLLASTSKDYYDGDGNLHQGKELKDLIDKQKEREGEWYSEFQNSGRYIGSDSTSGSIPSSLMSHFNSFMSFVSYVFNQLPGDIKTIYIYGFVALVALGIVLKVMK